MESYRPFGLGVLRRGAAFFFANYWISSVDPNASDANAGTSREAPWATTAPLLALAATPGALTGKRVGFERGGSYAPFDTTVIVADDCSMLAYGAGDTLPFFDCTASIPAAWTLHAAGIWKVTLTRAASVKNTGNYFRTTTWETPDGVEHTDLFPMRKVESLAALSGKGNYACFADGEAGTTITLYMNAPSDPGADGAAYRWSRYSVAVNLSGARNRIAGLWARGNANQDGMFRLAGDAGGHVLSRCRMDWGCRHSALVASGPALSIAELNEFNGGANEVDPIGTLSNGTANSLVFNSADHQTAHCISQFNVYNGMGRRNYAGAGVRSNFTGPYGHDSVAGRAMATFVSEGDEFIDMAVAAGACGIVTQFKDQKHTRSIDGMEVNSNDIDVSMTGLVAGSTIDRLLTNAARTGITLRYHDNGLVYIPDCGAGASGWVRAGEGVTAEMDLDFENNAFVIQGTRTANANRVFIDLRDGALRWVGNTIGPAVAPPVDLIFDLGTGVAIDSDNDDNAYPVGSNFRIASTTYRGLVAYRVAAGGEVGSTYRDLPSPEYADTFNGSDANLETLGYTRISGAAGALQRKSNLLYAASTTQSVYTRGDLSGLEHYVSYTLKGISAGGGPGPALRILDGTTFLLSRQTSTQHQLQLMLAGVSSVPVASSAVTPAVDQHVVVVLRNYTDPFTEAVTMRAWIIVDGGLVIGMSEITAASIVAEPTVGAIARNTVTDMLDDLSFGPAPIGVL